MRPLAVIGHVARDVVGGGEPRIGGAPWYAGRAFRLLNRRAQIAAKCGEPERRAFAARLATLGLPVSLRTGGETTSFSLDYDGDRRRMGVGAVGEPWRPAEALAAVGRAEWVHVGPLLRSDFPAATLAALARGRRLLVDAQGLVRVPKTGPLEFDREFDSEVLRHIAILKLAEEEAVALTGGIDGLEELGIPEIVVTLAGEGCAVITGGRLQHVPARAVDGVDDPTGAGDAFAATYIAARSDGHRPASAARRATSLVSGLLAGRVR